MRIYLVGYMGSGKSTQGKRLAKKLGLEFLDMDDMIREAAGMAIPEIFAHRGESWFREIEADVLRSTIMHHNVVVSTGGGTPCFFDNMQWMNTRGSTVYFHLPIDILFGRLKDSKKERPLIAKLTDDELRDFIIRTVAEREYYYRKSDFTFQLDNLKLNEVAEVLRKALLS